jgi:hypothetical protein
MSDMARVVQVGEALPAVTLRTGSGDDVSPAAWLGRALVLVCVRYYG